MSNIDYDIGFLAKNIQKMCEILTGIEESLGSIDHHLDDVLTYVIKQDEEEGAKPAHE